MKEFRETERSVSMNWQVCGRKKFMVDATMNGQPVKLCENGRDVISFLAFCDSSSCYILCCMQTIKMCSGQASKKTFTIV